MALPKEVNLFGTTIHVHFVSDIDESDYNCGETDMKARTIQIRADLPLGVAVETFYHELTHVILDHLGLCHLLTEEQEELFAQSFGVALTYLVSANTLPGLPQPPGDIK